MDFKQLEKYFGSMPIAFTVIELVTNSEGKPVDFIFRYANLALAQLEEISLENLLGKHFFGDVFSSRNDRKWLEYYYAAAFQHQTLEMQEYSPEVGKYLKIICYPWFELGYCACILSDETSLVYAKQRLEYLAHYDATTKFGNRNAYRNFLTQVQDANNLGVIFVDLNGLKALNDHYGHESGDFLFRMVSDRIKQVFPNTDSIFRVGGDEFVIILPGINQEYCKTKVMLLRKQMLNPDIPHFPAVLASVGWSWAACPSTPEHLIRQADQSMYEEKRKYYDMVLQQNHVRSTIPLTNGRYK